MNLCAVDRIAHAVLYEGYLLYPYRRSSVKNQQRWTFGALYPPGFTGEASLMQTECLVRGTAPMVEVRVRFLQLAGDEVWQQATERELVLPEVWLGELGARTQPFSFEGAPRLFGLVELRAVQCGDGLSRLTVRIRNTSPLPDGASRQAALLRAFVSTHTLLGVRDGEFVSLLEPPDDLREASAACVNTGTWPVLVGGPGTFDTVLSSPIILYDYPSIAKESPGDLFDGTEIDEILTLRILTLTDDEKREMRETDPRARALLERTEALGPEDLRKLHGVVHARAVQPGDRVRLHPRGRSDAFDVLLAGKEATVASVEETEDGQTFLAVTVDDDPGRDLGTSGQPGHRFFYRPDEVDPLP